MDWHRELSETNIKIGRLQREQSEKTESFSDFALQSLLDWKKDIEKRIQRLNLKADLNRALDNHASNHKEVIETKHKTYEQLYEEFTMIKKNLAGGFDSKAGKKVQEQSEDKRKRISTGEEIAYEVKQTCSTKGWF
ncbi:hypothetical protein [Isobaculum melis]|uniref:Uncharacterized protein n=1 Tax=Isobaculum melis TaxID=142588 RepID=A0A1H9TZL0_9LACT|nr:hypothetical protein [Isobaculum melis]SES02655.1 hypothetical protein SAMN04488559_1191 [Isobaculum melis]